MVKARVGGGRSGDLRVRRRWVTSDECGVMSEAVEFESLGVWEFESSVVEGEMESVGDAKAPGFLPGLESGSIWAGMGVM